MSADKAAKVAVWVLGYVLFSWLGLLLRIPPNDIAAFWPAAGVGMAAVYWAIESSISRPVAYSIVPIAYILSALPERGLTPLVISYAVANAVEAVLVAEFVRVEWRRNAVGSRRNRIAFVGAAIVAPAISAFVVVGLHELLGEAPFAFQSFVTWWLGDSIGLIAIGPVFIGFIAYRSVWRQRQWRLKQFVLPMIALLATSALLFVPDVAFSFPGIIVTIWWAIAFGFGPTSMAIAVFSSAVAISSSLGISQFSGPWALPLTQIFVATYALALMSAAAMADARRRDLAQVLESEKKLQKAVSHDPVTGLLWRGDAVSLLRTQTAREKIVVAVLDVDGMGRINDVLGRTIGDQLLEVLAQRFVMAQRPGDVLARLGGDEFLFVVRDIADEDKVQAVVDQLIDGLMVPADVGSAGIPLSVCAGVTYGEISQFEALLRDADHALHEVKQHGRGLIHIRTSEERRNLSEQRILAEEFAPATQSNEIYCVFQPIVPLTHALGLGAEALVRWSHPRLGNLSPGSFIPSLENSAQMVLLGQTVSRLALEQLAIWLEDARELPKWLTINVHAQELRDGKLHTRLLDVIEELKLPPQALVLELTEHSTVNMEPSTRVQLDALRSEGVRIALDDFGTGYSSLAYLSRLPVDILKLDAAFLSSHAFEKDRRLIKAICSLANDIGLNTIVEGVETEDQLMAAIEAGADSVQGYWLGRPTPGVSFGQFRPPQASVIDARQASQVRVSVS